jgi:hypothetical protein
VDENINYISLQQEVKMDVEAETVFYRGILSKKRR